MRKIILSRIAARRIETILLTTLAILFFFFAILQSSGSDFGPDLLAGCILSLTNAFLGYVFIQRAFRLNSSVSILLSLAGLVLRFFMMLASIAVFLVVAVPNAAEFVGSFMAFYTIAMFAEIMYINRKTDELKLQTVRIR